MQHEKSDGAAKTLSHLCIAMAFGRNDSQTPAFDAAPNRMYRCIENEVADKDSVRSRVLLPIGSPVWVTASALMPPKGDGFQFTLL